MKTAVEWLADELKKNHGLQIDLYKEIEQAKEMEKEQIKKLEDKISNLENMILELGEQQ